MRRLTITLAVGLTLWSAQVLVPQDTTHFEVASIKPADTKIPRWYEGGPGSTSPGRVYYSRVSLRGVISDAYRKYADRISGSPLLDREFTISATMPPTTTKPEFTMMLRNLLKDRFLLTFHTNVKEASGYELLVGPHGSKLTVTPQVGATKPPDGGRNSASQNRNADLPLPQIKDTKWIRQRVSEDYERMTCKGCSIAYFADRLSYSFSSMTVPVIDHTGLTGEFDIELEYPIALRIGLTPDPLDNGNPFHERLDGSGLRALSPLIAKQCGLTLHTTKVTLESMIVDHVEEEPTNN